MTHYYSICHALNSLWCLVYLCMVVSRAVYCVILLLSVVRLMWRWTSQWRTQTSRAIGGRRADGWAMKRPMMLRRAAGVLHTSPTSPSRAWCSYAGQWTQVREWLGSNLSSPLSSYSYIICYIIYNYNIIHLIYVKFNSNHFTFPVSKLSHSTKHYNNSNCYYTLLYTTV